MLIMLFDTRIQFFASEKKYFYKNKTIKNLQVHSFRILYNLHVQRLIS